MKNEVNDESGEEIASCHSSSPSTLGDGSRGSKKRPARPSHGAIQYLYHKNITQSGEQEELAIMQDAMSEQLSTGETGDNITWRTLDVLPKDLLSEQPAAQHSLDEVTEEEAYSLSHPAGVSFMDGKGFIFRRHPQPRGCNATPEEPHIQHSAFNRKDSAQRQSMDARSQVFQDDLDKEGKVLGAEKLDGPHLFQDANEKDSSNFNKESAQNLSMTADDQPPPDAFDAEERPIQPGKVRVQTLSERMNEEEAYSSKESARLPSIELAHGDSSSEDDTTTSAWIQASHQIREEHERSRARIELIGSQNMNASLQDGDVIEKAPHVEEPISTSSDSEPFTEKSQSPSEVPSCLFFHLELGIGGAERLVVCMARAVSQKYRTTVATTRFNSAYCFPECLEDKFRILKFGSLLPRNFLGIFTALFSMLRLAILFTYLLLRRIILCEKYDLVINDQLAMFNPLLYMLGKKVAFYCHFPDSLMVNKTRVTRGSTLYRLGIDALERQGTRHCDKIWTNSNFTKRMLLQTFNPGGQQDIAVLHPCVPLEMRHVGTNDLPVGLIPGRYFLSLNRYEIKKNHLLALLSFSIFLQGHDDDEYKDFKLVVCGGYDETLLENYLCVLQLEEAVDYIDGLNKENVVLIKSASDCTRLALLRNAAATVYTPSEEHFGIVPIESMSQGTPVIAVNQGGPMESITEGVTGSLVEAQAAAFAKAMEEWKVKKESTQVACELRSRNFSYKKFSSLVLDSLAELAMSKNKV